MTSKYPYRVFVSTTHPGDALSHLSSLVEAVCSDSPEPVDGSELQRRLAGVDGLISVLEDKITSALFEKLPDLKIVANVAVGFDNIDIAAATKAGVLIVNTPGVLDNATADIAFALLITTARRLAEGDRFVRSGRWNNWRSDLMLGQSLEGKTLGIIGLGRIGQAMCKRALGFEMKIVYSQRNRASVEVEQRLGAATHLPLDELLRTSDFISIHCPLTAETHHMIDASKFALMKASCILVNTGRGPIIDEKALIDALACRRIAGAGLDVFEHEPLVPCELFSMENVVLAPHIGSATVDTRSRMARLAVDGLLSAFDGKLPANAVNPEVWPEFSKRLSRKLPVL
jgi:glyoxylate reductase